MGKTRIYEIAKELGLPNKEVLTKVRGLGLDARNHMSSVDSDEVQRIKRAVEKERVENREVKRISATVIRRRAKASPAKAEAKPAVAVAPVEPAPKAAEPVAEAAPKPEVEEKPAVEAAAAEAVVETKEAPVEKPAPAAQPEAKAAEPEAKQDKPEEPAKPPGPKMAVKPPPPAVPKREIRFAPGFKPPPPRPPKGQPRTATGAVSGAEPMSAAEVAKMMTPTRPSRPRVVITDLDAQRRRKDLFAKDRRNRGRGNRGRKRRTAAPKRGKKTEITMPAEHKRVIRMGDSISVGEIARQMAVKSTEVLKQLWGLGMTGVTINQAIDSDTAGLLATEFGFEVENTAFREEQVLQEKADNPEDLRPRAPVVTVMGHVDHGKTSLLDAIRGANIAAGEAGGITQHTAAYRVTTPKGDVVFLDTPGHAAFTAMRARGAQVTDVVVLVVAADDGVMPQTIEAIDHAKDAEVPIVVAINKMDKAEANPDRVLSELAERNLVPEEWGGDTQCVRVSAQTKDGIDDLLESLIIQADLLELQANPEKAAKGTIVEARMDRARGAVATVLVQEGTLNVGDTVVAGAHMGKVRAMLNHLGKQVEVAGPSTPVDILGLGGVPAAGDLLNSVADDKAARQLAEHRHGQSRSQRMGSGSARTYEDILGQIQSGQSQELKVLLKADVQGSSEAIRDALGKVGTEKISVNVISANVGGIYETDVNLAKAAGAVVIGFDVRAAGKATTLAEKEGVEIRTYDVIYELIDDVKTMMRGLLPKERQEKPLGQVEVRDTFTIPKIGTIAGAFVTDGKISRAAHLRLFRDNVKVYEGKVGSLRRFKDDVREVQQGYECGIGIEGYNDIRVGDVIEAYEIEEVTPSL